MLVVLRRSRKKNSLRVPQRFSYPVGKDLNKNRHETLNQKKTDVEQTTLPDGNRQHDIGNAEEDLNKIHVVKEESE